MNIRRLAATTLALGVLTAAPAAAQQTMLTIGGDYTASFTGDDLEGLDNAMGVSGGLLFPMGPISFLGFEAGWSGVSTEGDADGSMLDLMGVARVGLGYGESARPYVDVRAGWGRLSFDEGIVDYAISGASAGGTAGVMFRAGGVWIDVHGRYQHHWFGEAEGEGATFDTESSGGRVIFGAALNVPFGG